MPAHRVWTALIALVLSPALPAMAVVVLNEDFEDDIVDDSANFIIDENGEQVLVMHQQNGPPTNVGKAGTWIPNQYDVNRMGFTGSGGEWFDPSDVNPDTNWQFGLIRDLTKIRTLPQSPGSPDTNLRIPDRPGNEGFLISHHQGDCDAENPCDVPGQVGFPSIRLNRGGFIKFSDANGTSMIAEEGDTLRFSMDFIQGEGNTAIAFTNDIDAMVARTADEDLNPPYSKWNVGFGEAFTPLQPDLGGWQGNVMDPYVMIQVEFISGFNQEYFGSRLQNAQTVGPHPAFGTMCEDTRIVQCSRNVELVPDTDTCPQNVVGIECGPTTDPAHVRADFDSDYTRYQTLELEYTVGDTIYKMWMDGVEVSTQFTVECNDCPGKDVDQEYGQPIPVSQLPFQIEGEERGLIGPVQLNGLIIGATGDRSSYGNNKNSTTLVVDNLCVTINQALEGACFGGGPAPLLGDANNDNQVTGGDLISVQQNFGKDYTNGACDGMGLGDANDDCLVTGSDLISVQQNFGKTAAPAVPEPATMLLWGGGLLAAVRGTAKPRQP